MDKCHAKYYAMLEKKRFFAPIESNPQKILDLGCGTGIWCIDVANEYPSAEVLPARGTFLTSQVIGVTLHPHSLTGNFHTTYVHLQPELPAQQLPGSPRTAASSLTTWSAPGCGKRTASTSSSAATSSPSATSQANRPVLHSRETRRIHRVPDRNSMHRLRRQHAPSRWQLSEIRRQPEPLGQDIQDADR
ncbi:hypothetical protein GMDG_06360 [Pseudogymnoascus destructans 20631-21]|uniref:Methyltransferase domain-containing protein n=2 Tax=Pseudogymnoascus destructans TaxID=655981 RepID=L8FS87_PSED2|nr:hypothetical protein GMDG_06360 [Pseudogymnoascus destructans 20631-21]